jgi:hypothetical protein
MGAVAPKYREQPHTALPQDYAKGRVHHLPEMAQTGYLVEQPPHFQAYRARSFLAFAAEEGR